MLKIRRKGEIVLIPYFVQDWRQGKYKIREYSILKKYLVVLRAST